MTEAGKPTKPVVLVTGSTGLIGTAICRDLRDDYEVVGLDRDPPHTDGPDLWLSCDLTDDTSVKRAFQRLRNERGDRLASVVHLAAYYDFSGDPSPLYDDLTVEGTRRVLRELQDFDVEQFVFTSSLLVMAQSKEGERVDEDSPTEAEWEYPRSKLDAEAVIREERGGIPAIALRIAGVYDEGCHSIPIGQQMSRIFERKLESYLFPGDPDHGQPYVHMEDAVRAVRRTIEARKDLDGFRAYLIGEEDLVSYGQLQDLIGESLHGKEWPTIRIPAPVAKAGAWAKDKLPGVETFIKPWMIDLADAHVPISTDRARNELSWAPRHSLRETLPTMCRELLEDPRTWYRENGLDAPNDAEERAKGLREHEVTRG